MSNVMSDEEKLRQMFRNHSNCYADTNKYIGDGKFEGGEVVQAIDEDRFIELVTEARKGVFTAEDMRACRNEFANILGTDMKDFEDWLEEYRKNKLLTERKGR